MQGYRIERPRRRPQGRHGPIRRILGDTPLMSLAEAERETLRREKAEFTERSGGLPPAFPKGTHGPH